MGRKVNMKVVSAVWDKAQAGGLMRKCGSCTLCCTLLAIPSMKKPVCARCPWDRGSGCSVYVLRPIECRQYACLWLLGSLAEEYKPDKCGVVAEVHVTAEGGVLIVHERQLGDSQRVEFPPELTDGKAYGIAYPDGMMEVRVPPTWDEDRVARVVAAVQALDQQFGRCDYGG